MEVGKKLMYPRPIIVLAHIGCSRICGIEEDPLVARPGSVCYALEGEINSKPPFVMN